MDKHFQEFLDYGARVYCARHGLQCCHLCNRICCTDNTNPVVVALKRTVSALKELMSIEGGEPDHLDQSSCDAWDHAEYILNNFNKLKEKTD